MNPERLVGIPLFDALSPDERVEAARHFHVADVEPGHRLCDRGKLAYEFFVIATGEAEVLLDDEVLARLGPGDFFGEVGLLQTERRTASVVAATPMQVVVSFAGQFRRLLNEIPSLRNQIAETARSRWTGRDWTSRA
jgi:CRP-like cAMP-binding protein